jgi:histidyl-tRNA synthetase
VLIDPSVVRGLEYYTGPVYEAELLREVTGEDGKTYRIGSIGGGGRYDDLVARFTGETRAGDGLLHRYLAPRVPRCRSWARPTKLDGPVVVLNLDKDNPSIGAVDRRRTFVAKRACGLRRTWAPPAICGKQMKYADRRNAPAVGHGGRGRDWPRAR